MRFWSLAIALMLAASPLAAQPLAFAVNSDAAETPDRLLRVDLSTGQATVLANFATQQGGNTTFGDIEGLAFDAGGTLYAIDDDTKTLFIINPATGSVQLIANGNLRIGNTRLPAAPQDPGITFSCDGELLLATGVTRSLYRVNPTTGQTDLIGNVGGLGVEITDLAAAIHGVYGLGIDGLYRIDASRGTATLIGGYGGGVNFASGGGLAFDAEGQLWAVADRGPSTASAVYRIDRNTGRATAAGTTVPGIESLAIVPSPCAPAGPVGVPVPLGGVWSLGLIGLLLGAGLSAARFSRA
jgi:outer membrane protein assembly factor BamB